MMINLENEMVSFNISYLRISHKEKEKKKTGVAIFVLNFVFLIIYIVQFSQSLMEDVSRNF